MDPLLTAALLGFLILAASMVSVELGLSVAIIEILVGVAAGNLLGLTSTPWIDFLASLFFRPGLVLALDEEARSLVEEQADVAMPLAGDLDAERGVVIHLRLGQWSQLTDSPAGDGRRPFGPRFLRRAV